MISFACSTLVACGDAPKPTVVTRYEYYDRGPAPAGACRPLAPLVIRREDAPDWEAVAAIQRGYIIKQNTALSACAEWLDAPVKPTPPAS